MPEDNLNNDTLDFIKESFNLALGRATNGFSSETDQKIVMSIPNINLLSKLNMDSFFNQGKSDKYVLVQQPYMGNYKGHCFLIFDINYCIEVLKKLFNLECKNNSMDEEEIDKLLDFSNIVFSECLDEFEKILGEKFISMIPEIKIDSREEIDKICQDFSNPFQSFIHLSMSFTTENISNSGLLNFIINSSDLDNINKQVAKIIEKMFSA